MDTREGLPFCGNHKMSTMHTQTDFFMFIGFVIFTLISLSTLERSGQARYKISRILLTLLSFGCLIIGFEAFKNVLLSYEATPRDLVSFVFSLVQGLLGIIAILLSIGHLTLRSRIHQKPAICTKIAALSYYLNDVIFNKSRNKK